MVDTFLTVAGDKFKVFISWSGALAKNVATVWFDLVKETFDSVEPFMSEENIGAGERGLNKIAAQLSGTSFGIIVVTQENQNSPWLNYEAGALSKDLDDQTVRVAPSLVDFERKNDVAGPLGQFQASLLNREGVEFILIEIAKVIGVDDGPIRKRVANSWNEYSDRFEAAKTAVGSTATQRRSNDDILDEILTTVRELARTARAGDLATHAWSILLSDAGADLTVTDIDVSSVKWPARRKRQLVVLDVGDRVAHEKYGLGVVVEVSGDGESQMSLIDFGEKGKVKLMHNHAPVKKLET